MILISKIVLHLTVQILAICNKYLQQLLISSTMLNRNYNCSLILSYKYFGKVCQLVQINLM